MVPRLFIQRVDIGALVVRATVQGYIPGKQVSQPAAVRQKRKRKVYRLARTKRKVSIPQLQQGMVLSPLGDFVSLCKFFFFLQLPSLAYLGTLPLLLVRVPLR